MKKQYIHILALALGASMLMVACAKEEQVIEEPQNEKTPTLITESLTATKEGDATKVGMTSGRVFTWNTADQAAFTINDGGYSFAVSENYNNGAFTVSYSGTRKGYAVIPSRFVKDGETVTGSYDGTDLTVCYPDNYDISADVEAATPCDDNADGTHFIPFPMVAKSVSENKSLTFYSIGALVRVQMKNIPAGTKHVYVTFNQIVTGEFTVVNPDTEAPYVEIPIEKKTTPSTVTIKVSNRAEGLVGNRNITLYIPVPTTTNLKIASSTKKMATVARNGGYAWSVDAITRATSTTDFKIGEKNYIIAPGNLLASFDAEGKLSGWSFLDGNGGLDQLKTVFSSLTNDPHNPGGDEPTWGTANTVRDVFTWNKLYEVFMGEEPTDPETDISTEKTITIEEKAWRIPTLDEVEKLVSFVDGRDGILPYVKGNVTKRTRVIVQVGGSIYENYGITKYTHNEKKCIAGVLLFPDGYVDQTDILPYISGPSHWSNFIPGISYAAFAKIIAAGAIFLPQGGFYSITKGWDQVDDDSKGYAGVLCYWTTKVATIKTTAYVFRTSKNIYNTAGYNKNNYISVRLIRSVDID